MPSNTIYDNRSQIRKVTLTTGVYYDSLSGLPYVRSFDVHGSQLNISLSYLPVGVTLNTVQQGQVWWVEKRTTAWTLMLFVGEYNPYCYALFNSSTTWNPSTNPTYIVWVPVVYDLVSRSIPASLGHIVSDPTTGYITVPAPGLYDIYASVQATNNSKHGGGQLGLQVVQPTSLPTNIVANPGVTLSSTAYTNVQVTNTQGFSTGGGLINILDASIGVRYVGTYTGIIDNSYITGVQLSNGSTTYVTDPTGIDTIVPAKIRSSAWSALTTGGTTIDAIPIAQLSTTFAFGEESFNKYNRSFLIQAAWGGSTMNIDNTELSGTFVSVTYRGPVN